MYGQRQGSDVLAIQLFAGNSLIDQEMLRAQTKKSIVNDDLMMPLVRGPDYGPDIRDLHFQPIVGVC